MLTRVNVDLNQRKIGFLRAGWNWVTPTRGGEATSEMLAACSSRSPIRVLVGQNEINFAGQMAPGIDLDKYPKSSVMMDLLFRAGVREIDIDKGTSAKDIFKFLNTLTDRRLQAMQNKLSAKGVAVEIISKYKPETPIYLQSRNSSKASSDMLSNILNEGLLATGLEVFGASIVFACFFGLPITAGYFFFVAPIIDPNLHHPVLGVIGSNIVAGIILYRC